MHKLHLLIALVLLGNAGGLAPHPAPAATTSQQTGYAAALEAYLQRQMATYRIPGMAIAIVRDGKIEYLEGLGVTRSGGEAVTPDTPFLLASVSKSMTAVCVMQLVEEGLVNPDDPVQKYLPWFDVAGEQASAITIAHLLYQTSGFTELGGVRANLRKDSPEALEEGVRALASEKLRFEPGQSWEYSNLNYNVLGLLVQQVTGERFEDYLASRLFAPLEMRRSYTSLATARAAGAASGHYPFLGIPIVSNRFMPYGRATLPSAGVWSTAADMSRYLIAHLSGTQPDGARFLSETGRTALHTPNFRFNEQQGYAMGWTVNAGFMPREQLEASGSDLVNAGTLDVLYHEGDWTGYKAMAFLIPELQYGVILLMNGNDPTVTSALRFFAWDVTLIATGGEAQYFPPAEAFPIRNIRWMLGVLVLLVAVGLAGSLRLRHSHRRGGRSSGAATGSARLLHALPVLASLALVGYFFFQMMPDQNTDLPSLFRFAPDLAILLVLFSLLSAGWALAYAALWKAGTRG